MVKRLNFDRLSCKHIQVRAQGLGGVCRRIMVKTRHQRRMYTDSRSHLVGCVSGARAAVRACEGKSDPAYGRAPHTSSERQRLARIALNWTQVAFHAAQDGICKGSIHGERAFGRREYC